MLRHSQILITTFTLLLAVACGDGQKTKNTRLDIEPIQVSKKTIWPGKTWLEEEPGKSGLNTVALGDLEKYAFQSTGDEKDRKGIRTNGLVIIYKGKLVYEKYNRGYTKDTRHLLWSVSKSFVNTLYGMAVLDGKLKMDDLASKYEPTLNKTRKRKITLRHLMNMSSGLYWEESYELAPLKSLVVAMLYTRGRRDMGTFAAKQDMYKDAGKYVYYSSGTSNILTSILKTVLKDEYADYPFKRLFNVLGMQNAVWEKDASGNYIGSSYIYSTPRDLARFGYLYLNDGVWQGKRILPEQWVDFTRTPAPAHLTTKPYKKVLKSQLTAHWYSNLDIPNSVYHAPWPDAPRDTFAAVGHWGQRLFVIPSLNMVIARTGDDRDDSFDVNEFLKLAKKTVP